MSIFLVLFFMGLVQGLTEFLPVSSSGHLVLLSNIFGVEESLFLSILLHVATLLSICVVFYKDIFALIRYPFSQKSIMNEQSWRLNTLQPEKALLRTKCITLKKRMEQESKDFIILSKGWIGISLVPQEQRSAEV